MLKNDEQRYSAKIPASNSLTTLPSFVHSAFVRHPSNLKPNLHLISAAANHFVAQLHSSILSTADKLHILALQNPLLSKLLSFSAHVQSFSSSQFACRNHETLDTRCSHNFAAILPGDSVAGVVVTNGILNFLSIYNTLLVVRLVLTWFPTAPSAVVNPLSTLCDPYLNIFRGVIPPLGGTLDLSPILAFLVLNAFTGAAAALPAEIPSMEASQDLQSHVAVSHLTTSQRKWLRRAANKKSKCHTGEN